MYVHLHTFSGTIVRMMVVLDNATPPAMPMPSATNKPPNNRCCGVWRCHRLRMGMGTMNEKTNISPPHGNTFMGRIWSHLCKFHWVASLQSGAGQHLLLCHPRIVCNPLYIRAQHGSTLEFFKHAHKKSACVRTKGSQGRRDCGNGTHREFGIWNLAEITGRTQPH